MLFAWVAAGIAWGGTFYLESPLVDSAAAAETMRVGADSSEQTHEVVRRHIDQQGWRYLVRVGTFEDERQARKAAISWASEIGVVVRLYGSDEGWAKQVAVVEPQVVAPASEPVANEPAATEVAPLPGVPGAEIGGATLLARAMAAHGIQPGTLDEWLNGPLLLEYVRSLPDGREIEHVWAAQEGALYLKVKGLKGDVTDSRTLVTADKAWLYTEEASWTPQNHGKTHGTLVALGPQSVLPFSVGWASVLKSDRSFVVGTAAPEGRIRLRAEADASSGAFEIDLQRESPILRRIWLEDGDVLREFAEYREANGVMVPHRITLAHAGQVQDTVEIRRLELGKALPTEWFVPPE